MDWVVFMTPTYPTHFAEHVATGASPCRSWVYYVVRIVLRVGCQLPDTSRN